MHNASVLRFNLQAGGSFAQESTTISICQLPLVHIYSLDIYLATVKDFEDASWCDWMVKKCPWPYQSQLQRSICSCSDMVECSPYVVCSAQATPTLQATEIFQASRSEGRGKTSLYRARARQPSPPSQDYSSLPVVHSAISALLTLAQACPFMLLALLCRPNGPLSPGRILFALEVPP